MQKKRRLILTVAIAAISLIALAACSTSSTGSGDNAGQSTSSDATLKSLTLSAGTLAPTFAATTTDYSVDLAATEGSLTVIGVANDSGSTVGGKSGIAQILKAGTTAIVVTVTAADGKTTKSYTVTANKKPNVYAAGRVQNGKTYPCFWKNGVSTLLDIGTFDSGTVTGIVSVEGTVYSCGNLNKDNTPDSACYWAGSTRTDLAGDGTRSAYAFAITVDSGHVYVAGYYQNSSTKVPCYWKDGVRVDLPGTYYEASALAIKGGKPYIAGFEYTGTDPCYWADGTKVSLDRTGLTNARAQAITIADGKIYVAGRGTSATSTIPCLWTDGARTDVSMGVYTNAKVSGMTVMNGSVYLCGDEYLGSKDVACYWNGSTHTILSETYPGFANCMTSYNGTLYTGGRIYITLPYTACYWIGTTRVDLETAYSEVNAIYVGE